MTAYYLFCNFKNIEILENLKMFEKMIELLSKAKRVAVLTGAGVSAESGIATFRDPDGLWSKFNPAELASMQGFLSNPELVWEWYNYRRQIIASTKPNAGHYALAEMQKLYPHFSLATQNVDKLHHQAGSTDVLELHGNIIDNYCVKCKTPFTESFDLADKNVPKCKVCSGNIRPAVVWFGEMLPEDALEAAAEAAETSEVYFTIGTSAEVYPAANLPIIAKRAGAFVVEINPNSTAISSKVDLRIAEPSAIALPKIINELKKLEV